MTRGALSSRPLSRDGEEFLSYLSVERGRAPASVAAYRRDLAAYEEFLDGRGCSIADSSAEILADYLAFLAAAGRRPASIARALAALRGMHRFCCDERGATADPTEQVRGPRLPSPIPKALSEEETERLLGAVTGAGPYELRDRAILELLYATGVRISELAGLSLADLDLDRSLVLVFGKGSKERVVPFGRHAAAALGAWLGAEGRQKMAPERFARRTDCEAVFISARGRRMTRQAIWAVVRAAAVRAGLGAKVTPHVLRHTCATHLLEHGADIRVVQELLGHAAITTTQVYTRVSNEMLRRVYESAHPRAQARRAAH